VRWNTANHLEETGLPVERERKRERERERWEREKKREETKDRQKKRDTDREKERDRERQTNTYRQRKRESEKRREKERARESENERASERKKDLGFDDEVDDHGEGVEREAEHVEERQPRERNRRLQPGSQGSHFIRDGLHNFFGLGFTVY